MAIKYLLQYTMDYNGGTLTHSEVCEDRDDLKVEWDMLQVKLAEASHRFGDRDPPYWGVRIYELRELEWRPAKDAYYDTLQKLKEREQTEAEAAKNRRRAEYLKLQAEFGDESASEG